jgi:hypothetical protein
MDKHAKTIMNKPGGIASGWFWGKHDLTPENEKGKGKGKLRVKG